MLFLFAATSGASAQTPASGAFAATQVCPATRSIHGGASADDVLVQPGQSYTLVGKNKPDATHYLIEVEGAEPLRRWVATKCGTIDGASSSSSQPGENGGANLLAVSWQSAFCENHAQKQECATQTPERFDATHFTLHGLWPQPRGVAYCNVADSYVALDKDHNWDQLPPVALSDDTLSALTEVMPAVASKLERHEWIVHGTCFRDASSQDAYFARAVKLMAQLNASPVRDLFAHNIGGKITADQIKQAFDDGFGAGAGDRVMISCPGSRRLIVEMTIGLVGRIDDNPSLAQLIAAAKPVANVGCPSGVVDAVKRN
ncbi:hypothetical protein CCR94_14445 [Rhodoblastus sphagnicola]|uniref:Uncharacterized protein n=2 Tax=Rhodoblastus sphagnicola TaxID=333368 RepID=A0A2S6N5L8_9HYPH|nr:ribonuclease T2 [Rhodoblastus sphagnicola]PPQ29915.1 hypothetical protein CCR94_14445 [Rhodoblastus sphagnicola]